MDKYNLSYTGEHLENIAVLFERLAAVYGKLARMSGSQNNPLGALFAKQIMETGQLIREFTGEYSKEVPFTSEVETVTQALYKNGIKVGNCKVIERTDGRHEIRIELKTVKKKCPTAKDVAQIISECLFSTYDSFENNRVMLNGNFNTFIFMECGRFEIMHGIARVGRDRKNMSGDSVSFDKMPDGKAVLSLSDGMGSGKEANMYSQMTIELIEEAISCGFSVNCALSMVNTALAVSDIYENPMTMDMCVVDTFLGMAEFIKMGAVSTYILRDGWVEVIQSDTLPMGVFSKTDFDHVIKKMYPGDYIIMISDGVLESMPYLDKEEAFMSVVAEVTSRNPQSMAYEILDKVMDIYNTDGMLKHNFTPEDDMTIVVMGIFGKQ